MGLMVSYNFLMVEHKNPAEASFSIALYPYRNTYRCQPANFSSN